MGVALTLGSLVGMAGVASATTTTNTVAPVAAGSYVVGGTLTVTNGTWSNAGSSYSYAWYSCTSNTVTDPSTDGSCTSTGGTSSSYEATAGDLDHYLYAVVSVDGSNGSGSFSALSNAVGQVASTGSLLTCGLSPLASTLSPQHPTVSIAETADAYVSAANGTEFGSAVKITVNGTQSPQAGPASLIQGTSGTFTFQDLTGFLNGMAGTVRFDFYAYDNSGPIGESLCHISFTVAANVPVSHFKPANYVIRSFASGSSQLSPLLKYEVNRLATKIINYVAHNGGTISVKLTGYADVTGPSAFNQALSLARAKAVKALLLGDLNRHHVSSSMVTIGMGSLGHTKSLVNSRRVTAYVTSAIAG